MKEFVLFDGFNYYNLCIALLAIPIFIKIFNFIMGIEDEEVYQNNGYTRDYLKQYDYEPRHAQGKPKHGASNGSWWM